MIISNFQEPNAPIDEKNWMIEIIDGVANITLIDDARTVSNTIRIRRRGCQFLSFDYKVESIYHARVEETDDPGRGKG